MKKINSTVNDTAKYNNEIKECLTDSLEGRNQLMQIEAIKEAKNTYLDLILINDFKV